MSGAGVRARPRSNIFGVRFPIFVSRIRAVRFSPGAELPGGLGSQGSPLGQRRALHRSWMWEAGVLRQHEEPDFIFQGKALELPLSVRRGPGGRSGGGVRRGPRGVGAADPRAGSPSAPGRGPPEPDLPAPGLQPQSCVSLRQGLRQPSLLRSCNPQSKREPCSDPPPGAAALARGPLERCVRAQGDGLLLQAT